MKQKILSLIIIAFLTMGIFTITPGCSMTEQDKKQAISTGVDIGMTLLTAYLDYKSLGGNSAAFDIAFDNAVKQYTGFNADVQASDSVSINELQMLVNKVLKILQQLR